MHRLSDQIWFGAIALAILYVLAMFPLDVITVTYQQY